MANSEKTKLAYALSLAYQLGFLIVAPLVGFIWLGVYLDQLFRSTPSFLLIGLTLALSVTGYETYRVLRPLLEHEKDETPPDPLANLSGLERQIYEKNQADKAAKQRK